jgi:hypothetical protein
MMLVVFDKRVNMFREQLLLVFAHDDDSANGCLPFRWCKPPVETGSLALGLAADIQESARCVDPRELARG